MSMTEPGEPGGGMPPTLRRRRLQGIGAAVGIVALLWALLLRSDVRPTGAEAAAGWIMVAGLAGYLLWLWRRQG